MDDRFGTNLAELLPGIDIFMNNNLTTSYTTNGKISFDNVCLFINNNGGKSVVMPPEIVRTKFSDFNSKFTTSPTQRIGNIPQYKEISENEK